MNTTILTLNVEHQLLSPVDLNLVVQMEHWLWIILAALCFGETQNYITSFFFASSHVEINCLIESGIRQQSVKMTTILTHVTLWLGNSLNY